MANEVGLPIAEPEGPFFTFKDVISSPVAPKMSEPFIVKGKIDLFKIPFFGPLWVIATVTYPSVWWEEIVPIWGSPEVRATDVALGGNFEITFAKGFQREGEFSLSVRVYPGPTFPIDSIVLPPVPAAATAETTFIVAGEAPPQEELFKDFSIASYSKNGGTPVTPPGVLELDVGDRCRLNLVYNHKGPAVSGKFHAAIWHKGLVDPHDEILFAEPSFSVPPSDDWETYEHSVDIIITSAISPGSDYGLYCKIMGITGGDVFTEYLENVITITGVPVKGEFRNFGITGWTPDPAILNIGDSLIITHHFEYKGPRYTGADIHSAIGTRGAAGFDEILAKSVSLGAFGPNEDWTGYDVDVTIPITAAISPGVNYDLYSKLTDIPGADLYDYKDDIIEIVGAPLAGSITRAYINKAPEGSNIPLPTTVKADGNTFEVCAWAKNTSTATYSANLEVTVRDPDNILRYTSPINWAGISPNEELRWGYYNVCKVDKAGSWTIRARFVERTTSEVLDEKTFTMTATSEVPEKEPPEIDILPAENIIHDSATLSAELIDEGFCSGAYCYIEWGRTTSYGEKSPVERLQPGWKMDVDISGLKPDTKYYFRAVAEGRCVSPYLVHHSQARTFTTKAAVVVGFSLRVVGAPAAAYYWNCHIDWQTGEEANLWPPIPIGSTWHYEGEVPSSLVDMLIGCYEKSTGGAFVKSQRWTWVFRLYAGQNYIYDFSDINERWWE